MAELGTRRGTRAQPPLLVFIHVPKTAGTTVRTVLSMNEAGERTRSLSNVFKGSGGLDKTALGRLRRGRQPLDLKRTTLLRGHLPLGVREYLPRYLSGSREVRCFSFLRDPIDRSLSHYYFIREKREGSRGAGKYGPPTLPTDPSMDDMLESGYLHDNLHTRMLSGLPEPFGEVTDEMLEQAKQNLREELVFFGLTERFDESLVLAKHRLGLTTILYKGSGRVSSTRPRGDQVPADLVAAARRHNRYDIELYRYAEELFDRAPERQELDFEVEVAALGAAKGAGEIELDAPVPKGFVGAEQEWRMLLHARASLMRSEWDRAHSRIPRVAMTAQGKALQTELKSARARTKELEQEVVRLNGARSRTEKLEQEVKRLKVAAASRPKRASKRDGSDADQSHPKRDRRRRARAARDSEPRSNSPTETPSSPETQT